LPEEFYRKLDRYSKEAGLPKEEFISKAIDSYIWAIRRKVFPESVGEKLHNVSSAVSKAWWSKLTAEEKRARAMRAVEARREKMADQKRETDADKKRS
jgi:predicted DNA-binding protein